MHAPDEVRFYEFGPFRFDAEARLLFRNGGAVALTPKAAETLHVLVVHHGRVLEKGELIRLVWPDTFVEEGGLARNISALRRALGDEAEGSRFIETIPKRGYRFVAPVATQPAGVPERRSWKRRTALAAAIAAAAVAVVMMAVRYWPGRTLATRAIAVLPLRNLSESAAQEYFSEGVTELLTTNLAKIPGLTVISRSSVLPYRQRPVPLRQIRRDLKVEAVVDGSVVESGGRVRITAQLVETASGRLLWADSYERAMTDVLALESEMAGTVAERVLGALPSEQRRRLSRARPVSPAAYHAYLRGRFCSNRRTEEGLLQALEYFQEARAKDPGWAPAHAGIADTYALLGSNAYDSMPPAKAMPLAKAASLKALELDELAGEAHTSLAYVLLTFDWNLEAAAREFRRALELSPGYPVAHQWYAHYHLARGQMDHAAEDMRRALELDPLSLVANVGLGWCHYLSGDYDEAARQYRRTLELEPNFALAHQTLGMAYEQQRRYGEALDHFRRAVMLSGEAPSALAALGRAHAEAGRREDARQQLQQLTQLRERRYVPAIYIASIWAALGEREPALQWLTRAREERSEYFIYLRYDPMFRRFAEDKRFRTLLP